MSMVGSLHKRSFITGFFKIQPWVQYSLLCIFNHCLKSFLEVGADITNLLMILNFTSSTPPDFYSLIVEAEQCADSFGRWMTGNRLKLNNDKSKALLVGSRKRVSVLQENHLRVGNRDSSFKDREKHIGIYPDATLSMVKHTCHISIFRDQKN